MTARTPDIKIDVDLRNPGQFFACCGLLELASRLWPGSEGWFSGRGSSAAFHVAIPSDCGNPLEEIIRKLCEPDQLVALAKDDWMGTLQADRQPVILLPFDLRLDWWLDSYFGDDKSELKTWAGQQTPERNINNLRDAWRTILSRTRGEGSAAMLLAQRQPITGRFGFDPSASWEALDIGFSPDEQGVPVQTAPATEILAAVGLQRCRPEAVEGKRRWFRYRAWSAPLDVAVAPAVIVGSIGARPAYDFPVVMRNQQYGSFGWAQPARKEGDEA